MSKNNRLVNGRELPELEQPVELKLITKCPEKWILIDEETGQVYRGSNSTKVGQMWKLIKK